VHVHGWVYDIREGLIKDLEVDILKNFAEYEEIYKYYDEEEEKESKEGDATTQLNNV
jgi:succinate dehydrogenase/fumarate reductase-like Fe-S protein